MDSSITSNPSYKKSIKAMHYFNCPISNFWDISQSLSLYFTLLESIARETLNQLSSHLKDESLKTPYGLYQSNLIQYKLIKNLYSDSCIQEQWQCSFQSLPLPCFVSFDIYSMSQELSHLVVECHFPQCLTEDDSSEQKFRKEELTKVNNNLLHAKYSPTQSEFIVFKGDFSLALSLLIRKEIFQTFIEPKRRSLNSKFPVITQITSIVSYPYHSKLKVDYEEKDIHCAQIQLTQINSCEIYIVLTHYYFIRTAFTVQEKYSAIAKMFFANLKKTLVELNAISQNKLSASSKSQSS